MMTAFQLHCKKCSVEWVGDSPRDPCWFCGEQGFTGLVKYGNGEEIPWCGQVQRPPTTEEVAA